MLKYKQTYSTDIHLSSTMYDLFYSVSLINSLAHEHNGKEVKEYRPVSNVSLLISLLENTA